MESINIVDIQHSWQDYPTPSNCITVYFCGCSSDCDGCHNVELQSVEHGKVMLTTLELHQTLDEMCERWKTDCVCLMGGDPLHPHNWKFVKEFLDKFGRGYDICLYTGYDIKTVEKLVYGNAAKNVDFLKCGVYDKTNKQESLKTDNVFQLASKNQMLYKSWELVSHDGVYKHED